MKKVLYIFGMHCASCDLLIRETIHELPDIHIISLTEKGVLTYDSSSEWDYLLLKQAIESCGYRVSNSIQESGKKITSRKEYIWGIGFGILLRWVLYTIDLTWYVGKLWTDGSMWYTEMMLLWFFASLSTCLALVGWFVLMRWSLQGWIKESFRDTFRHQVLFQIWRVWWYAVWWAVLWWLWSSLIFSPFVNGIVNALISMLLLCIWWNMLWWRNITLPNWWWGNALVSLCRHLATKKRWSILVGAFTFLLPCGFSQVAQINALATWDMLEWSLLLVMFALGTLPVLLVLWVTWNRIHAQKFVWWHKMIGIFLVVLSLFLLVNASKLLGVL